MQSVPADNSSRSAVGEVNPFRDLNINSKWTNYFSEKWGVVEPLGIHLGVRYDSKRNKVSGVYEQVPLNNAFIHISLLRTLEFIFKNEEVVVKLINLQVLVTHTRISVMENTLEITHCFQNRKMHCKFKFTTMTLKQQMHWGLNKLGFFIAQFTTTSKLNPDEYPSYFFVSFDAKMQKYSIDKILTPLILDVKVLEHN